MADVSAPIAAVANSPRAVQVTWSADADFDRSNPLVSSLAPLVGLTDTDVDNLFIEAAKL